MKYILPNRQLKISPLANTNDPRENKQLLFGSFSPTLVHNLSTQESLNLNQTVSEKVREDCKVLCFSYSNLLDGYQLSNMWAYYGSDRSERNKHTGVCIAIDFQKFVSENSKYFVNGYFDKVNYVSPDTLKRTLITERYRHVNLDKYIIAPDDYIKNDFRITNLDYLYFTKGFEWEREQEARLIYFSKDVNSEYCTIKNSLTHVFLGLDFDVKYLPDIISAVGHKTCPIWLLEFSGEWIYCRENIN